VTTFSAATAFLRYRWAPDWTEVHLDQVDMGTAATANEAQNFADCTTDYEGLVSGVIRVRDSQLCPGP
jgi:hypothetical protein